MNSFAWAGDFDGMRLLGVGGIGFGEDPMVIVGSLILSIGWLFIVGMRPFEGGGSGYGRILLVHPYKWLRLDLVPPAPFLQCEPHLTPRWFLGSLLIQPGLMRNSEKPGSPTFVVVGKGRPTLRNSLLKWTGGFLYYLLYLCLS